MHISQREDRYESYDIEEKSDYEREVYIYDREIWQKYDEYDGCEGDIPTDC